MLSSNGNGRLRCVAGIGFDHRFHLVDNTGRENPFGLHLFFGIFHPVGKAFHVFLIRLDKLNPFGLQGLPGFFIILAGLIALVISLGVVSIQVFKAARTNPVESLRYE